MPSAATTVSGSGFAVSAASPATNDAVGFAALTYTSGDTCEITSIGDIGTSWSTTEDNTVCPGLKTKKKASEMADPFSLGLNYVKGDAMQAILDAAYQSKTDTVSVELTDPNGTDKTYFEAQVTKNTVTRGGDTDFIQVSLEFEFQDRPVNN